VKTGHLRSDKYFFITQRKSERSLNFNGCLKLCASCCASAVLRNY